MTISVRNPRTGQVDCEFEPPAEAQLQQMCTDLREHQIEWYTQGIDHRIAAVKAWKSVLIQNREVLMDALTLDTGRLHETVAEIDSVPTVIDQWCEIATDFFRPQVSKETSVPFIHLQQQFIPYPLVGVISPWNVPHVLAHIDAIPAMLAGCAVIIKPSEFTPRFVEPLQQVAASIPEIGAVLRYVQGAGEAGAALVDTVDLVCFTGSIKTGRQVGERASQNFIPCFLELGGKDAAVVLETANIDRAASAILWGSVVNAGQSCLSIERIYVAQAIHDEFVARLVSKAERLRLAHPEPDSGEIGPIISPDQAAIIIDHLHDAVKKGAVVHCGGELESHEGGEWIRPTVLSNVDHDMKVMTEETFGPVMPVMSFFVSGGSGGSGEWYRLRVERGCLCWE